MVPKALYFMCKTYCSPCQTCSKVQHVEIWGEVVADVSSGQVVQVGLKEEVPAIPVG